MRPPFFLFALAVMAAFVANAVASAQPRPPSPATFTHPERGYTVAIPPGAEMKREERQDLMVQSRKGYRITVQSAPHAAGDTPEAMLGRLDELHLGEGKTWSRRLDAVETTIAGHRAVAATYEGSRTRTQVVIVLAGDIDLVLMFFAPSAGYEELVGDFRWFLDHVTTRAGPTRRAPPATAAQPPPPAPTQPPPSRPGPKPQPAAAGADAPGDSGPWPQLAEPSLGYRVTFPRGWTSQRLGDSAVFFSGPQGSDAFLAELAIQNVSPGLRTGDATAAVLADLKRQLAALPQARIVLDAAYPHVSAGVPLAGQQIVTEYAESGRLFEQWTVVLPHDPGATSLVHVFTYRAPKASFATYRQLAGRVLSSLTFEPRP